jgi:hypothetical protein
VRKLFDRSPLQQPWDFGCLPSREAIAELPREPSPDQIADDDMLGISSAPAPSRNHEIPETRSKRSGESPKANNKLVFVVVTFPQEIEMFYLQLKSVEKFVDTETMGKFYVFWNSGAQKTSAHIRDVRAFIAGRPGLRDRTELLLRDDIFGRTNCSTRMAGVRNRP